MANFVVELNGRFLRSFKRECNAMKQAYQTKRQWWFDQCEDIVNVINLETGETIYTSEQ